MQTTTSKKKQINNNNSRRIRRKRLRRERRKMKWVIQLAALHCTVYCEDSAAQCIVIVQLCMCLFACVRISIYSWLYMRACVCACVCLLVCALHLCSGIANTQVKSRTLNMFLYIFQLVANSTDIVFWAEDVKRNAYVHIYIYNTKHTIEQHRCITSMHICI